MAQWQNVVALHRILSSSRSYRSRKELAGELEVPTVTFDRLVRVLRDEFNAPLVFSRKYGGYRYETKDGTTFELPGLWFRTEELEALIYMESIAEGLQRGFLCDAFAAFRARLEKVLESRDVPVRDLKGRFKVISIANRKTDPELFLTAAGAVLHRNRLKLLYHSLGAAHPRERTVYK
ncbi:MAG: helix-turn-helix transcriptional regulator [Fibrobacterota bacterium]